MEQVHGVNAHKRNPKPLGSTDTKNPQNFKRGAQQHEDGQRRNPICGNCGLQHDKKQCPAYGKQCRNCGKFNHFHKWCRSKKVNLVQHDEADETNKFFVGAT